MSGKEQRFQSKEMEIADRVASVTIPGESNMAIFKGLQRAAEIAQLVEDDLNNWIDIIDARVYGENMMGIAAEYRWTIYRWGSNDMEGYMADNGWNADPHRLADSYKREEDQMEARYRKKFGDMWVYINILVLFPDRAFDELNAKESYEQTKEKKIEEKEQQSRKKELRMELRD